MKKPIILIPTEGKTAEQIKKEVHQALRQKMPHLYQNSESLARKYTNQPNKPSK